MKHYKTWIGAFAADTAHLPPTEVGVYKLLLDHYYATEQPLRDDWRFLERVARCHTRHERAALRSVIAEFFTHETVHASHSEIHSRSIRDHVEGNASGFYRNARADKEILAYQHSRATNRSNVVKGRYGKPYARRQKTEDIENTEDLKDGTASLGKETPREAVLVESAPGVNGGNHASASDAATPAAAGARPPPCPYEKLVELYHKTLPELRRVEFITNVRKAAMFARWRTEAQSVEEWEWFFKKVRGSPFLMGKVPGSNGRPPFMASFDWLIRPTNFIAVAEGKYERAQKAR